MKKQFAMAFLFVSIFVLSLPVTGECARSKTFYDWLAAKGRPIKTYVADVTDSSAKAGECVPLLKKDMEDMLVTRKKIQFVITQDRKEADIIIGCNITEFFWTDSDPVDQISGIGPIIMDSAIKENYGRLTGDFIITDAASGEVLWERKLKATITGMEITPQNAAEMLSSRMMDVLTKGAISRPVNTNLVTGPKAR